MLGGVDGGARHFAARERTRRSCDRHRVVAFALLDADDAGVGLDLGHERFDQTTTIHEHLQRVDRADDATHMPLPRRMLSTPSSTTRSSTLYKVQSSTPERRCGMIVTRTRLARQG